MSAKQKKQSPGFLSVFGSKGAQLRADKARLEAFLSAVPGEYCGWAHDESAIYSHGFCEALGLQAIDRLSDIQNVLLTEDSLALEGLFGRLVQSGIAFTMTAQKRDQSKSFKISGTRGQDLTGVEHFHILWLELVVDTEDDPLEMHREMDRLQEALDALQHPVWIRDKEQKIIWCNVSYARTIDARPSEIIAQQKEIISVTRKKKPGEKNMLFGVDLAKAALEKGSSQTVQTHHVLGGKRVLLKITEAPVKVKNITVGMAEDLTEHENMLDTVNNNQNAHLALLEQLRSAIGIYGAEHRLEFYNSAFAQLWGLEEGWLNTRPKLSEIMEKLRETRRLPEQADFRSYKKSWLDMFTSLIEPHEDMLYLPDGSALRMLVVPHKMGGLMMTFEDVTSRLELESSYNTLIAVQKETLDNLAEGVAVYGGDGRLKLWNPSFARIWGFDPEALEGEPHVTRIIGKIENLFDADIWADIKEKQISIALDRALHEGRLERSDNILLDYATVPLPDGGVLVTYTDVSDTVRVEKALRDKNAALEAAERLKIDFLANVSYQLRTPLSAIMGFNEMLAQEIFGALNDKQKEYIGDIHYASERLLNLINDILDLSTIEAGQMDLDIKSVKIKPMMESIADLVTDWARKEKIEVEVRCASNIGAAMIDETRVKQAMINLVRNAIAHTSKDGVIELRAARKGDFVQISVRDNGTGIAEEDQVRVMQPFERIITSKVQGTERGAGLGLTIVQNIVSLHNGVFDLESEVGKGTIVTMTFPKEHMIPKED